MLSWLVIGIGDITTRRVIPAILSEPRSKLAGIVTRDPRKAEPYGVPAWSNLADGLAVADAVYVATPVFLHAPQTILCLHAGKHVLCEKPMGMNYAEASAMEQAAREASRVLGIAYYRRLYPKVDRAKELLESGAIGRRYRRQDEIGTPSAITVDFETLGEKDASLTDTVTLRDRDSMKQERVKIGDLLSVLASRLR